MIKIGSDIPRQSSVIFRNLQKSTTTKITKNVRVTFRKLLKSLRKCSERALNLRKMVEIVVLSMFMYFEDFT